MAELDVAAKVLLREAPEDLAGLFFEPASIRGVLAEETTLPALSRTVDKLLRIELEGEEEPLRLHVEVQANWAADVPRRMHEYWALCHRSHERLLSVLICLKPGSKQGEPRPVYEVSLLGRRPIRFEFELVKVWELEAADLLARVRPGLLPLLPFASGSSEAEVDRAMQALAAVEPRRRRSELQVALATFAGNTFPQTSWLARIPREILMESTTYQEILAEGQREGQRKLLVVQLQERLGDAASPFVARLATADEVLLTTVAKLLARKRVDAELKEALDAALPSS